MAKKVKRKVSTVVTPAPAPEVMEVRQVESSAVPAGRSFNRRAASTMEFNPDYTYVVKDLKRIGMLAGTFFVVLIVLSFIIK